MTKVLIINIKYQLQDDEESILNFDGENETSLSFWEKAKFKHGDKVFFTVCTKLLQKFIFSDFFKNYQYIWWSKLSIWMVTRRHKSASRSVKLSPLLFYEPNVQYKRGSLSHTPLRGSTSMIFHFAFRTKSKIFRVGFQHFKHKWHCILTVGL